MYGGMSRNKFMVTLATATNSNETNGASSRTESISDSFLEIKANSNNDAPVINFNTNNEIENENCLDLQHEIDEAVKVLMDDCGKENHELLLLSDLKSKYLLHFY